MKRRLLTGILVLMAILCPALIDYAIRGPRARARRDELARTLAAVEDPPDSRIIRTLSLYKTSQASAIRDLTSALSPKEVRSFYLSQLEPQGWKIKCEHVISNRDRIYLVDDEDSVLLVLDLPNLDSPTTGQYYLELSWGLVYGDC